jgi:histidyl-tRNA synthetase
MSQALQTLKGFRDFLPAEKRLRDAVAEKIKQTFQRFGFEPLETPTLEYAELLLGKYGAEADKLVYTFEDRGERQIGLRYDQTVPTARVLAQYQGQLPKYFRRYQIQSVFRADKPQKGRYREFTQCDVDVFGSQSAVSDAEVLACTYAIFQDLGLKTAEIQVNDRQSLFSTLSPFATETVPVLSIIQSIDKLDKVTPVEVTAELVAKGLTQEAAEALLIKLEKSAMSANLQDIVQKTILLGVPAEKLKFSPNLARGLDYYTGLIFEIRLPAYEFGSFGGGGRYDHLIETLGGPDIPAVGFALGFDRVVEAVKDLGQLATTEAATQVLVTIFSEELAETALEAATAFRSAGIRTEVFPAVDKLGKQFKYADTKQIPWAVVIGESEAAAKQLTLKNLATGEQTTLDLAAAIAQIRSSLS